MVEENTTGNEEDVGDAGRQKAGNNDAAADVQQGDTQDAAGNQDKIAGLKAAAVAEREKRQAAEAEAQAVRDQMAIMTANAQQNQFQPQQQEQQASLYQAVAKQLGIDTEYATPVEQGAIFNGMMQVMSSQQSEQSFVNSHPDYAEVVGTPGPGGQFQYSPPLIRALKANPALANALQNSPNRVVLAYEIASKDPQYLAEQDEKAKSGDTKAAEKAEAKIKAANQQLSVSAAKGGGNLDQAAAIAAMSDEEFAKHNQKIMDKAV